MLSRAAQLLGLAAAHNGQAMVAAACVPLSSALSRGLSSAEPEQPELNIVAPPVRLAGLQGRLASAVWSAATATDQMDKVASDMAFLKELTGDPEFNFFLKDPFLPRDEKVSKMHELMAETGMSDISKNLISTMAETNSLKLLPKVTQGFEKIMTHIRGDLDCTVVTARPLSDAEQTQIEQSLREMVNAKQQLQMTVVEDPSIMGGMIFKLGDKLIDCSIKTRLAELELMIMEESA